MLNASMLFVTNLHFSKDGNGGQQRTYYLIKELSNHFNLVVISPYIKTDDVVKSIPAQFIENRAVKHLKYYRGNIVLRQFFKLINQWYKISGSQYRDSINLAPSASHRLTNQIRDFQHRKDLKDFNIIVYDTLSTVVPLEKNLFSCHILNAHNFDSEILAQRFDILSKTNSTEANDELKLLADQSRLFKKFEHNIDCYFDEIWVCSYEDEMKFKEVNPNSKVKFYLLSNGSDTDDREVQKIQRNYKEFLFVGSLDYAPNYEGLKWFVDKIFKHLPKHYKLNIVGKSPDLQYFQYVKEHDNINLIGEVKDVRTYYSKYDIIVVPLLEGSGTRLKILEAMSYGKIVLSTAKGIEGIKAIDGTHYLEFKNLKSFNSILSHFDNDDQLNILREKARELVEYKYSWRGIVKNYVEQKYG